jgi:hypothetical protein
MRGVSHSSRSPRSNPPTRVDRASSPYRARLPRTQLAQTYLEPSRVRRMPRRSLPGWVQLVIKLQRSSNWLAGGLISLALLIYGSTVYTQQTWSSQYRQLDHSQRSERQMSTMAELMKEKLAKQASSPKSGMVPKNSSNQMFVPAAPARPVMPAQPTVPVADPRLEVPLGY